METETQNNKLGGLLEWTFFKTTHLYSVYLPNLKILSEQGDYLFRVVSSAFFYLGQHVYVPNKKAIELKAGGSFFWLDFQKED